MFRKLFASPHRRRVPRLFRKLMLEALEDRLAPATYSLTDLSPLQINANTGPWPGGQAINTSGELVGSVPLSSGGASAVLYNNGQLTNLGTLSDFRSSTFPTSYDPLAINNAGEVVGVANNAGAFLAFVSSGGQMTSLTQLASLSGSSFLTDAVAINNSGQIAGAGLINGVEQAFLYSNGSLTDLGSFSGSTVAPQPTAINDSGQIVGHAVTTNGTQHAFLYSNGQLTDLGTLAGNTYKSGALAINASGQIVGFSQVASGGQHAFLYSNGTMTDLGVPSGFVSSEADGINASGQIIGSATMSNGLSEAFLYNNGTWINLNQFLPTGSSFILTNAFGINDNGQIVAGGSDGRPSYLLTPQQTTGTVISNGTASPNTLTVSNNGQQVTVSVTVNTNGSPVTTGKVVFSLVGPKGTVVSDGPTGVAIGSNGQASDTLTLPGGAVAGAYTLQVVYTNNNQTTTQAFTGALNISSMPTPTPLPTPTPTPTPTTQAQVQQGLQDVLSLAEDMLSGNPFAFLQALHGYQSLSPAAQQEVLQTLNNDLFQMLMSGQGQDNRTMVDALFMVDGLLSGNPLLIVAGWLDSQSASS